MKTQILTLLVSASTLALAGCTTVDGLTAEAEISYDGTQNGSHSDKAACDAEGKLTGRGDIQDGAVQITIRDGQDETVFERTFDSSFDLSGTRLDGHAGTWTLHAQRTGDDVLGDEFNGDYDVFLNCEGL